MMPSGNSYEEVYRKFRWEIPERYNIAEQVCDRHDPGRPRSAAYLRDRRPAKEGATA